MIIHLTGADAYRSNRRLAELRSAFIAKHDPRRLNVVDLDGQTATVAEVKNAVTASGMFSAKRFVAIDRYNSDGTIPPEKLAELIQGAADKDSEVIVVVRDVIDESATQTKKKYSAGKKSSRKAASGPFILPQEKREVFSPLTPAQTSTWILTEAKSRAAIIQPTAIQRLIALCNNDLWRIATELDKLISFAGGQSVSVTDVESMVVSENSSDIFALTDALGQRNSARALALLHQELAAGTNEFALISTLAGHIRTLYNVHQAQARGVLPLAMASELGLHPFVVQKASAQAVHFTSDELRDLHHRLVTIDHDLKTSPLDAETLLDLVIVQR